LRKRKLSLLAGLAVFLHPSSSSRASIPQPVGFGKGKKGVPNKKKREFRPLAKNKGNTSLRPCFCRSGAPVFFVCHGARSFCFFLLSVLLLIGRMSEEKNKIAPPS